MATKNCPKCDSPNPVACKKCACGHVFFTSRRSANAIAAAESAEDISEPSTPQEVDAPRRRTARETRQRPQFYDALQVENQTRRQRELQKRRKASKSDEVEAPVEEPPEKEKPPVATSKRRVESPPTKAVEPPVKKRRGRPPGLTNRKSTRAQILPPATKVKVNESLGKNPDGSAAGHEDELENIGNVHDIPAAKALQMNLVLSDINSRVSSSSVRAEDNLPPEVSDDEVSDEKETEQETTMETNEGEKEDEVEVKSGIKEMNGITSKSPEKMEVDEATSEPSEPEEESRTDDVKAVKDEVDVPELPEKTEPTVTGLKVKENEKADEKEKVDENETKESAAPVEIKKLAPEAVAAAKDEPALNGSAKEASENGDSHQEDTAKEDVVDKPPIKQGPVEIASEKKLSGKELTAPAPDDGVVGERCAFPAE